MWTGSLRRVWGYRTGERVVVRRQRIGGQLIVIQTASPRRRAGALGCENNIDKPRKVINSEIGTYNYGRVRPHRAYGSMEARRATNCAAIDS